MVRTRSSKSRRNRKKGVIKDAKGYRWGRSRQFRAAKEARLKAMTYAYRDRKNRKRDKRKLWQVQVNAAVKKLGLSYSRFVYLLKENKIGLDRKVLSQLARENPKIFEKIVEKVKE